MKDFLINTIKYARDNNLNDIAEKYSCENGDTIAIRGNIDNNLAMINISKIENGKLFASYISPDILIKLSDKNIEEKIDEVLLDISEDKEYDEMDLEH